MELFNAQSFIGVFRPSQKQNKTKQRLVDLKDVVNEIDNSKTKWRQQTTKQKALKEK
jgi:hypothetical protein